MEFTEGELAGYVLSLRRRGYSNLQISFIMDVSERTIYRASALARKERDLIIWPLVAEVEEAIYLFKERAKQ